VERAAPGEFVAGREFREKRTGVKVSEDLSIQRMDVIEV
jgi:hypothetical protein